MMNKKWVFLLLVTLMLGLASNSFAYKKVKCFVLKKPDNLMPGITKIAILDFEGEGDHGRFLADQLIEELLQDERGITRISGGLFGGGKTGVTHMDGATTKIFDIVERSALETVLQEQSLGMTGIIDDSMVSEVGKILGVDAIITGTYTINSKDTRTTENRVYYEKKEKKTKRVTCMSRTTSVTGSIRILGVESAEILGTFSSDAVEKDKKCDTDIASLATQEVQVHACMNKISNAFTNYINPFFIKVDIELEKIKTNDFAKIADDAAEAAEEDDIDKAYQLYYRIYKDDPYNPKLLYNLGVLNEIAGNYADANQFYSSALQMDDDKRIKEGIERVQQGEELVAALATVGVQINKHVFATSESDVAEAMTERVKIKGKREERFDVKERPLITSETIAQVPGDIKLKIVQRLDDWFMIELPDGKQGYIHEDDCVH